MKLICIKLISRNIFKWEEHSKALPVNSCIGWEEIGVKSYPRVWLAFEARLSLEQAPQAPILKKAGFKAFFREAIFTALLTCGQEWSDWLPDCWPGLPLVPSSSVVLSPKSWSSKFFFFFFPMIFLQKSPTHHFSIKIFCWPVFSKKSAVAENEPDSKTILQNKNTFSKRIFLFKVFIRRNSQTYEIFIEIQNKSLFIAYHLSPRKMWKFNEIDPNALNLLKYFRQNRITWKRNLSTSYLFT